MTVPGSIEHAPEFRLLCQVARNEIDATTQARLEAALGERLDGERLLRLAWEHGLVAMLYRHLVIARPGALPAPTEQAIAKAFRQQAVRQFRFPRRLREILPALHAAGIEALPYKGPALAVQLFGNYAMRQYGDLDILIQPDDVPAATRLLTARGLTLHGPHAGSWDAFVRRTRHNINLRDPGTGLLVELHWALANRSQGFDVDTAWLMSDPDQRLLLGQTIRTMNATATFLALTVHGARHLWERLGWLAEVAELIRAHRVDWQAVTERANQGRFRRHLDATLLLCDRLFSTQAPAALLASAARDRGARRLAGRIVADVLPDDPRPMGHVTRFRLSLLGKRGWLDKAAYCWRMAVLPSEADLQARDLSVRWLPAYALLRPMRLARNAMRQARK